MQILQINNCRLHVRTSTNSLQSQHNYWGYWGQKRISEEYYIWSQNNFPLIQTDLSSIGAHENWMISMVFHYERGYERLSDMIWWYHSVAFSCCYIMVLKSRVCIRSTAGSYNLNLIIWSQSLPSEKIWHDELPTKKVKIFLQTGLCHIPQISLCWEKRCMCFLCFFPEFALTLFYSNW